MIIDCQNISFTYDKKELVLKDINLQINEGDFVALLGPNGNGKTTLLKCLMRLHKYSKGEIYVEGKNIKEYKALELAKKIGYVPQYLEYSSMTVFDAILMGRIPYISGNESYEDMKIVNDLIERFSLSHIAFKNVNELSGGERQKVAIARALALNPKILMFDEPTSNLDIKNQIETMELIKEIKEKNNITVILTMHDINLALKYASSFILMKNGKVSKCGGKEIITPSSIKEVFGVDVDLVEVNGNQMILTK